MSSNLRDDGLRREVADCIEEHYRDRAEALAAADRILAIPALRDALETSANLRANQEKQRRMLGHSIKAR